MHVLDPFPTQDLLPLTLVSTCIHDIVLRILHFRLLLAAAAPEYKVLLEAYHPSRRYTRPYLFCSYLGTDGLSSKHEGEGSLYSDCVGVAGRLGKLGTLYSRFRPENPELEGQIPLRRIAGATPVLTSPPSDQGSTINPATDGGWSQTAPPVTPVYKNAGDGGQRKIVHTLNLDGGEYFAQFCAYANLVRLGPRRGVFLSNTHIVEPGQGTIRIYRQWLMDRCQETDKLDRGEEIGVKLEHSYTSDIPNFRADNTILWTDTKKNVGLKVLVRERDAPPPVGEGEDRDDLPLACDVELQGK